MTAIYKFPPLVAVLEIYEDLGKPLPVDLQQDAHADAIQFEYVVAVT